MNYSLICILQLRYLQSKTKCQHLSWYIVCWKHKNKCILYFSNIIIIALSLFLERKSDFLNPGQHQVTSVEFQNSNNYVAVPPHPAYCQPLLPSWTVPWKSLPIHRAIYQDLI